MTTYRGNDTAGRTGTAFEVALRSALELDRRRQVRLASGIYAESFQRNLYTGGVGPHTGGTIIACPVYFYAGEVVTNIILDVAAAGSALTLAKHGLYSLAGSLLAASADIHTAWQSTGSKTGLMTTPYTIPADGVYLTAVVFTGGTIPSTCRANAPNSGAPVGSGSAAVAYTMAGQTDLVSNAVWTTGIVVPWMGVS